MTNPTDIASANWRNAWAIGSAIPWGRLNFGRHMLVEADGEHRIIVGVGLMRILRR